MSEEKRKVVRLLGVGFDAKDGHVRITKGGKFDVLMGSEESHEYISGLLEKMELEINRRGMDFESLSLDEMERLIQSVK